MTLSQPASEAANCVLSQSCYLIIIPRWSDMLVHHSSEHGPDSPSAHDSGPVLPVPFGQSPASKGALGSAAWVSMCKGDRWVFRPLHLGQLEVSMSHDEDNQDHLI